MTKTARHVLLSAVMALFGPAVFAASVTFDIQPRVLALDETATATITMEGVSGGGTPQLPEIRGFKVYSSGRQQSFSFGSGGQSTTITYTYSLVPQEAGTFQVGPFAYEVGNQRFDVPPVQVQVRPAGAASGGEGAEQLTDLVKARITSERATVYNQEQFLITISILSRAVNLDRDISLMNMQTAGLNVEQFQELQTGREVIGDAIYNVRRFGARATALTAGTFKFEPTLRVNVIVQDRRRQNVDPFFGGFDALFGRAETRPVDVACEPLQIEVRPLPLEGRPPSFSGAVGQFDFTLDLKPSELNAGDPITLTSTVTGKGNVAGISAPVVQLDDRFKTYEPKLANKAMDESHTLGRLTFEQVVIPKSKDITELPAVEFSYFDPEASTYKTVSRGPFPLIVRQGSNAPSSALVQLSSAPPAAQTKVLGADILYLKTAPAKWRHTSDLTFYASAVFIGAQAIPPLVLATVFFAVRKRRELERDVSKARRIEAPRAARASLARADQAARAGEAAAFFEALWSALASYFGNRLNLSPGEVTTDIFLPRLRAGGLQDELVQKIAALAGRCESARFGAETAGFTSSAAQELIRETSELLRACERVRL